MVTLADSDHVLVVASIAKRGAWFSLDKVDLQNLAVLSAFYI
jgi:hypothetical protein